LRLLAASSSSLQLTLPLARTAPLKIKCGYRCSGTWLNSIHPTQDRLPRARKCALGMEPRDHANLETIVLCRALRALAVALVLFASLRGFVLSHASTRAYRSEMRACASGDAARLNSAAQKSLRGGSAGPACSAMGSASCPVVGTCRVSVCPRVRRVHKTASEATSTLRGSAAGRALEARKPGKSATPRHAARYHPKFSGPPSGLTSELLWAITRHLGSQCPTSDRLPVRTSPAGLRELTAEKTKPRQTRHSWRGSCCVWSCAGGASSPAMVVFCGDFRAPHGLRSASYRCYSLICTGVVCVCVRVAPR
jgi:hypothetical protein